MRKFIFFHGFPKLRRVVDVPVNQIFNGDFNPEAELTNMLSAQIARQIDEDIIQTLLTRINRLNNTDNIA